MLESLMLQVSHLNPSKESLKNQRGRSERALLGFVPDQFEIEARERERERVKGYWGYLYSTSRN